MQKHAAPVLAGLLVLVALAGCFQKPVAPACEGATCPPSSPSMPTGATDGPTVTTQPPVIVDQVNRTLYMRDCWGVQGFTDVPVEKVRSKIPDDFEIFGTTTDVGRVYYGYLRCEGLTVNNRVFPDAGFYQFTVFVTPKNESWRGTSSNHHYVLETRMDPEGAAEEAAAAGFSGRVSSVRVENVSASGSAPYAQQWMATDAGSSVAVDFILAGSELARDTGTTYFWSLGTNGTYQRQDSTYGLAIGIEQESTPLRSEGPSATMEVLGAAYPVLVQRQFDVTWTRVISPEPFMGGKSE